jgi:DNA invertase Pin-like site-specific DNA recombinase
MAVYGYLRVSTKPQTEGDSLEVQQRMVEGRALQDGLSIDRQFIERGVSGAKRLQDRPQGKAMLDALKPGDVVISSKLDRIHRSASDALDVMGRFKRDGISLILLDMGGDVCGSGISGLIFTILAAVAEFERGRIADRVSEMKAHEKSVGKYRGGSRPYGFQPGPDKQLVPIPEEQLAVSFILRCAGERASLRKIQGALVDSLGVRLSLPAINRIIKDGRVAGPDPSHADTRIGAHADSVCTAGPVHVEHRVSILRNRVPVA